MRSTLAGDLLREARTRAGLTQTGLAERAGLRQSIISVYESGRRQPSLPTLAAMVDATGYTLDVRVKRRPSPLNRLSGPLGRRLRQRRAALLALAAERGVRIIGVFGSVARGEDRPDSDIDLLIELPASMGLLGLGRLQQAVEELLEASVDVVPETDLKPDVRPNVEADLVCL